MIEVIREYPAHKNDGCSLVIIIGQRSRRWLRAAAGAIGVEDTAAMAGTDIHAEVASDTKESNVGFYEQRGFHVTGTIDNPDGGPRLWAMWREPARG